MNRCALGAVYCGPTLSAWEQCGRGALLNPYGPTLLNRSVLFSSSEVYGDYDRWQLQTQQILQEAAEAVFGSQVARRVDAELLGDVAYPPALDPRVYVCGPTRFVEAVADALVALGYQPGRIKTERFGGA